jgi:hypothetical protein
LCILSVLASATSGAQGNAPIDDHFSVTLERIGCLGTCPDYSVTIMSDGSVHYEGRAYVRVEGLRQKTISIAALQKLRQKVVDEHFFQWQENKKVCLDLPEVRVTVIRGLRRKQVVEGCNTPGKLLRLAEEIDQLSGTGQWVGNAH